VSESAKNPEDEAEDIAEPLGEGTQPTEEGHDRQNGTGADSAARDLLDRLAEQAADSAG
jgi:hypothetical protein